MYYRYGYLELKGYGLLRIERPPHWSEGRTAYHGCPWRGSIPLILRYSIPHIPDDEYALLFQSGVDLFTEIGIDKDPVRVHILTCERRFGFCTRPIGITAVSR